MSLCVGVEESESRKEGETRNLSFAGMLEEEKLDQCGSCLLVKMMNYATREGEGKKGTAGSVRSGDQEET